MTKQNGRFDRSTTHPDCHNLRLNAQHQGVSEPDNLPFMLEPPGAKRAALLVHGFTGTPWEMRLLGESLAEAGITCLAVRLPGHGTSPEDLAGKHCEEWLDAVLEGYEILAKSYSSIYGIGMSTGCLLLLAAVRKYPLSGLVLFSPYLKVLHTLAPYAGWLRWFWNYHDKEATEGLDKRYYHRRPIAGIHQINRLIKKVRSQLPQVNCPVLAFNGEGDQTVDIESGRRAVDMMGSEVKIYGRYGPDVPHVLTREENPCRSSMFAHTIQFIQGTEAPESKLPER